MEEETLINGLYGLDNLGNTCYLNSIIQTFANINLFRNFLLDKKFVDFLMHKMDLIEEDNLNFKLSKLNDSSTFQFYRILKTIWTGSIDSESLKPTTLRKKIGLKNSMFKTSDQQDAQEAFTILIEMMHLEIAQDVSLAQSLDQNPVQKACNDFWTKEYSPIYEIFHGMYLTSRTCSECNHITNEYNPNLFLSLDIPVPGTKSVVHDLNLEKKPFDPINYIDINCKIPSIKIDNDVKAEMCKHIDEKTLLLLKEKHLLITNFNNQYDIQDCIIDFFSDKIIEDVVCPGCNLKCTSSSKTEIIILPKVLCINIKRFANNLNKRNNHITFPLALEIQNTKYNLKSIINHSGSNLNYGHYYTFAYSSIHEKWYSFNDETVVEIEEKKLCTPNAYLLFYEIN
jgi:ubiquitin C-terminal hydrolase